MNPHTFEGTVLCIRCLKPKSDPIHYVSNPNDVKPLKTVISATEMMRKSVKISGHEHYCELGRHRWHCKSETCTLPGTSICKECSSIQYLETNENHKNASILDLAIEKTESFDTAHALCAGHKCPKCENIWHHDYHCRSSAGGLCSVCSSTLAVIINRPKHIEEIKEYRTMTGREAAEINIEHKSFLVLSLTKDKEGKDLPLDVAIQNITNHIKDLKYLQEKMKIKETCATTLKAEIEMAEISKISDEDREEFIKLARKNKIRDSAKELEKLEKKKVNKEKYKQQLRDLLSATGKSRKQIEDVLNNL